MTIISLCLLSVAALMAQQKYTLTLRTAPQAMANFTVYASGTFGFGYQYGSTLEIVPGDNVSIYLRDEPTGWKVTEWRATEGHATVVPNRDDGDLSQVSFTMPEQNLTLVAIMEYNPDNPDNPMPNAWYPDEGLLVLDYLNNSYGSSLLRDFIPDEDDYRLVNTIVMGGRSQWISFSDFNGDHFPNLQRLDLSRVEYDSGLQVSDCQRSAWRQLLLPACTKSFGRNAFEDTFLDELTIYATTPPDLSYRQDYDENWNIVETQTSFPDYDEMVVYVPEESLPLYRAHKFWKDFNLQPIVEDGANVNVSIDCADLAPFYGMTLQLRNVKSLYTRSMIISNRHDYLFTTLPKHTSYDVQLLSRTGSVVAQATNVLLADDDAKVTLSSLRQPCAMQLALTYGSGTPVTDDQFSCLWLDAEGRVLSRGTKIDGILEGEQLKALVTLSDPTLKATYRERDTISVTAKAAANSSLFTLHSSLTPIPTHRLTTIVRRADGRPFGRQTATIAIHRTATGELVRQLQFSQLTAQGLSSGQQEPLPEGEYDVTASVDAEGMGIQTQHLSLYSDQVLTFPLAEANGSTVSLRWTHYGVAEEGYEAGSAQSSNMTTTSGALTLRDLTNGRDLTGYAITSTNSLRLQEQIEPGTQVQLTVGSATNRQYAPATVTAVADEEGNLSFNAVTRDYGTLRVTFLEAEPSRVTVRIYDETGHLVSASNAVSATKYIELLPDGAYTVVLMEDGSIAKAMNTLTDVMQFLNADTDYASEQVEVSAGQTTAAVLAKVPAMGADTHLYTEDTRTSVTPKKPQMVAGSYQTLTTRVVFRPEYKGRISQLQAIFDLPYDVHFVEGTPIIENETTAYTRDGNRITIPIIEGRPLRFCVVPVSSGEQTVSARISFQLDGERTEQPLPVGTFKVSAGDITAPASTDSKQVAVSGTAIPGTTVTIFVNGIEVGNTKSNTTGEWNIDVPLQNTDNMGVNAIYAQYVATDGTVIQTDPASVTFDNYSIRPVSVRMSHYNEWMKAEQPVVFDLVNNTSSAKTYNFYHEAEFTFDVTLSTKDSTYIDNVLLYVYSSGDRRRLLFPKYNTQTGTWVATDIFNGSDLPSTVRVYVEHHKPPIMGDAILHDAIHSLDDIATMMATPDPELTALQQALDSAPEGSAEEEAALRQLMLLNGADPDREVTTLPDTPEAKAQWETEMDAILAAFDDIDATYNEMEKEGYFSFDAKPLNEMGDVLGGYSFTRLTSSARQYYAARTSGLQPAPLAAAGPNEEEYVLDLVSGQKVFYRLHDNGYIIVVPSEDLQISCDYSKMDPDIAGAVRELRNSLKQIDDMRKAPYKAGQPRFEEKIASIISKLSEWIDTINGYVSQIAAYAEAYYNAGLDKISGEIDGIYKTTMEGWDKLKQAPKGWGYAPKLKAMMIRGRNAAFKVENLRKCQEKLKGLKAKWGMLGKVGNFLSILSLINDYDALTKTYEQAQNLYYAVPDPCPKNQSKADALRSSIDNWAYARMAQKGLALVNDASSLASALAGVLATVTTAGTGVVFGGIGVGLSLGISTANWLGNMASDWIWDNKLESFRKQIDELECDSVPCDKQKPLRFDELAKGGAGASSGGGGGGITGGCGGDGNGNDKCNKGRSAKKGTDGGGCPGPPPPPGPTITGLLDPSGYVYEAVASNRVSNALASVYYKELYEDMYGDSHERAVLWDAENYGYVNPQLTDENGEYGWDVPSGMWQVRVVKDGYLDTYSEWLPVPPPQLDVNLAMQQPTAPVVERVVATEQGLQLRFDKYMKPSHLTADNIFVSRNGQLLDGTLTLQDAQPTPDSLRTYARTVLFQPQQPLKLNEKVRLTVKAGVESYANVGMLQDYTQEFDVEQRVSQLVADSIIGILHGEDYKLTLQALPAQAAKGKKVLVTTLNPAIVAVPTTAAVPGSTSATAAVPEASASVPTPTELTLDAQGRATIAIHGQGFGTTALRLTLADDPDVQTMTIVGVKDATDLLARSPKASRISDTEVPYGATVRLTSETPGATIYYTIDGSCPCDNPQRLTYHGPITLISDVTIKAIATAPGYAESDVASFTYRVKRDPQGIKAAETTAINSPVYSIQGIRMQQGRQLRPGLYIVKGRKIVVK